MGRTAQTVIVQELRQEEIREKEFVRLYRVAQIHKTKTFLNIHFKSFLFDGRLLLLA
uniref:Uncharacterized protein n=1 Tax=Candidozyma auris TaxID=498019 RepID=A0A0L0P3P5_CANAR